MAKRSFGPTLGRLPQRKQILPAARLCYNPYKRISAAVIVRAIRDYVIWHSPDAKLYRAAIARGDKPERARLSKLIGQYDLSAAYGTDPGPWLLSDTEFHRTLDLEPDYVAEKLKDPAKLLEKLEM